MVLQKERSAVVSNDISNVVAYAHCLLKSRFVCICWSKLDVIKCLIEHIFAMDIRIFLQETKLAAMEGVRKRNWKLITLFCIFKPRFVDGTFKPLSTSLPNIAYPKMPFISNLRMTCFCY